MRGVAPRNPGRVAAYPDSPHPDPSGLCPPLLNYLPAFAYLPRVCLSPCIAPPHHVSFLSRALIRVRVFREIRPPTFHIPLSPSKLELELVLVFSPLLPIPLPKMMQPPMDQQQAPPQQQWAMMPPPPMPQQQYYQAPAAAAAPPMWNQQPSQVPPPMMAPVQQMPPQPQQHYQAPAPVLMAGAPAAPDEIRTLWIGDLQYWMDENYLYGCFVQTGEVLSVKVIRNKQTGQSDGYGFIEFATRATAERVILTYNGQMMPNVEQAFRLNWASCGAGDRRGGGDDGTDHTIFVGDLASDVTDFLLLETFKACYTSVKGAKVVTDKLTGHSKGYGFVRFGDLNEQTRAMTEMNGVYCSMRPMRVGQAANKKTVTTEQQYTTKGYLAIFI